MIFKSAKLKKVKQNQNRNFHHVFNTIFLFTLHSSVFQIIPWNWKHLTNYIVTCAILCVIFLLKSKAINIFQKYSEIESTWPINLRKKLFSHMIIKNYLCNILWKFLIKSESVWRQEIKEQAPQLTLLYCGRAARSSHQRCWIKKLFLKFLQYPWKHLCWSLF